jgi:hypothetical protein
MSLKNFCKLLVRAPQFSRYGSYPEGKSKTRKNPFFGSKNGFAISKVSKIGHPKGKMPCNRLFMGALYRIPSVCLVVSDCR